jgi:hypothetical protein
LIAEDEAVMAEAIAEGLRLQALAVDTVHDGDAALERLAVNDYDVLILDRDLPGVHGDDVCRAVGEAGGAVRILMLTASGITCRSPGRSSRCWRNCSGRTVPWSAPNSCWNGPGTSTATHSPMWSG